jgi:putative two-component system response regulator
MERVLVVDDEKECRYALADALASRGFEPEIAEDGHTALKRVALNPSAYGFVYTDMRMPGVGGLELVEQLSGIDRTIVTVLLTGQTDSRNAVAAMRAGAFDFLSKPFTLSELEMSLVRATERRKVLLSYERERVHLHQLIKTSDARHEEEMRKMFVSSVRAHAQSIEAKDPYTAGHCDRVERYTEVIARRHGGFDEKWIFNLRVGAILHDIGKIGVRGSILCKPGALDEDECGEIRNHPAIGGRIVRTLYGLNLEPMVRHHHERFDGKGYPAGLKGKAIPMEARIILIADTFDAMTSDRPYRRSRSTSAALDELQLHAGTQFDPHLVAVALIARDELEAARVEMANGIKKDYFAAL